MLRYTATTTRCSLLATQKLSSLMLVQSRQMSGAQNVPGFMVPFMNYCSDCNWTAGINAGMELMHSGGLPWVGAFLATGVGLRLVSAPFHVYAERLFAKRIHAHNYFQSEVLKRVAKAQGKPLILNEKTNKITIGNDAELTKKADALAYDAVMKYVNENKLYSTRIQALKLCTVPFWIFSSFAIRNVIGADFAPALNGFLWIEDFLVPDPYFILPITVGVLGFLNLYSQRLIFPQQKNLMAKVYDGLLGAFTMLAVVIMIKMPACIPLYWVTVSATGLAQSLALRHPKVKNLLGIPKMPFDSKTPLRDLFWLRKKQNL